MIKPVYEVSEAGKGFWSKFLLILGIGFFYLFGIGVMGVGIFLITLENDLTSIDSFTFFYLFYFMVGIVIIYFGFWLMITMFAVYRFKTEGLYIKYPFCKEKCISWDEFQQVCVVYSEYHQTKGKPNYSCICFVRKGEKKNFLNRWKTGYPFKYYKVIKIPYTEEIYEGIKERCPYEVLDLRNTPEYKLW